LRGAIPQGDKWKKEAAGYFLQRLDMFCTYYDIQHHNKLKMKSLKDDLPKP